MRIEFTKMNGAGNDFVMIDNREGAVIPDGLLIRRLCERERGIGADGVILLERATGVDFRMRYFNGDGSEAEMCGNGARCAAWFAARLGLGIQGQGDTQLDFLAEPGRLRAEVRGSRVAVSMTEATSLEKGVRLPVAGGQEIVHLINTGVPHAVSIERDWSRLDDQWVLKRGRRIRLHEKFSPAGVNADFVSIREDGAVAIRTYERGVEAETLACGTGAVAAAVVLSHLELAESPVSLTTRGGELLRVSFEKADSGATDVVLEGPAALNFEGCIDIPIEG